MFLLRLIGLEWVSIPSDLIIAALIAASLVGFAEETLFRGVILRGLRTHNRSEGVVIVVTTVWFSAFHLVNIFLGLTFGEALLQSVIAACLGAILYLFRRGSGWRSWRHRPGAEAGASAKKAANPHELAK